MENSITIHDLNQSLKNGVSTVILDVRSPEEFTEQHVPNAVNIPLDLLEQITPLLKTNVFYVTTCGKGGGRSAQAANLLGYFGLRSRWLNGGTAGWYNQEK